MAGNSNSGRLPKPLRLHELDGSIHTTRHRDRAYSPQPKGKPAMPRGLSPDAKKLWHKVVEYEWVGESDAEALRLLCETWELLRTVTKLLQEDATDKDARIAWTTYSSTFDKLACKFGLNPVSRESLRGHDREDLSVREFEEKYLA